MDFPTLIGHRPAAASKQRPAQGAVTEFYDVPVIAQNKASFEQRAMVAVADIVCAAHDIAASALERYDFSSNRHFALACSWSMIFSENGFHPRIKSKGKLFGIML
jgi:hypothetical protein